MRVAEIIAPLHPHASADQVQAVAFGYLARPAELLELLLEHNVDQAQGESSSVAPSRATDFPADLLDAPSRGEAVPLARRPSSTSTSTKPPCAAPTRWHGRGLGPVSISALAGLLRRTRLTVRPVQRPLPRVRSISYEHPESLKEQVYLTTGGDTGPMPRRPAAGSTTTFRPLAVCGARPPPARPASQLRPPGPPTSPLEDPRRLPLSPVR